MAIITPTRSGVQPPNTGQSPRVIQGGGTISERQLIAQREMELARQRAAEEKRIEKELEREREAATRRRGRAIESEFTDFEGGGTAQDDIALFKEFQKNNPGVRLNSLDITRDSSGAVTSINGQVFKSKTDIDAGTVKIRGKVKNSNSGQSFSFESDEPKGPDPVTEAQIIGNLAGAARAAGSKTQFGYAISKDRSGNITGYSSNLYFPSSVKQSKQAIRQNYEIFKQNQIVGAGLDKPTAYKRNFPIKYDVKLDDSISGIIPGNSTGNTNYGINIGDTIGVSDKPRALPSNPATGFEWQLRNDLEDYMLGAKGSGVGIGALFSGLAGRSKPYKDYSDKILKEWGEEAIATERPSAFTGLVDTSVSQATGANPKAFENFAGTLASAPLFYAGSGFATGLQFLTPGSITKSFNFAAKGVSAAKAASRADTAAVGLADALSKVGGEKFDRSLLGVQAVKFTKKGNADILKPFLGGFTQRARSSIPIPKINVGGDFAGFGFGKMSLRKLTLPDAFKVTVDNTDLGLFPVKGAGKAVVKPMDLNQAFKLIPESFAYDEKLGTIVKSARKSGLPMAEGYTQFFAKESTGLKAGKAPPDIDPLKGLPVAKKGTRGLAKDLMPDYVIPTRYGGKIPTGDIMKASGEVTRAKAPKRVADVFDFQLDELANYGKGVVKRNKQIADAAKALGEMGSGGKNSPFNFEIPEIKTVKQPKTSNNPLDNITQQAFDTTLKDAGLNFAKAAKQTKSYGDDLVKAALGGFGAAGSLSMGKAFADTGINEPAGVFGYGIPERVRKKRSDASIIDYDFGLGQTELPDINTGYKDMIKQLNKGVTFTFQRDGLDKGPRFRGGNSTRNRASERSLEKQLAKLQSNTNDLAKSLESMSISSFSTTDTQLSTSSKTSTKQAQALQQSLSQMFGQQTATRTRVQARSRPPNMFSIPGFDMPDFTGTEKKRRRGKKRGLKYGEKKLKATDMVELALGKDYAKRFNKKFGLKGDPYGSF